MTTPRIWRSSSSVSMALSSVTKQQQHESTTLRRERTISDCHRYPRRHLSSLWYLSSLYILVIVILAFTSHPAAATNPKEYTNEFAVYIKHNPNEDAHEVAETIANKYGFNFHGQIGNLAGHYLFTHNHVHKRSTDYNHTHHRTLAGDESIHWVEQQRVLARPKRDNKVTVYRFKKSMPDPIYRDMWYLRKGANGGFDMNVENAWRMGYTGKNVVVTILDDGIQPNHPELVKNYDPNASYDINDNDPDPTPQDNGDNKHGTRCAGEVAAEAYNDFCGVGIAFNASIGGVRMLDGVVTDMVESKAIGHNPQHIDIYSASWGPEDDGKTVDGPGKLAKRAFIDGIKKGRKGKGSIYVWASGNGGRRLDNCNCDGYTNSIYTLSISSATQTGQKPWYLEECSSTLSTTYSSGTPDKDENIYTCDQDTTYFSALARGEKPKKEALCTRSHTGTSASAPIAAAIIALALEANPKLTWRDMQHLVVLSSRNEPLRQEKGWQTNGVGRKFSHKFGYGLLDAEKIVRYAERWQPVAKQRICETPAQVREREIPSKTRNQLEVSMLTNGCRGSNNEIRFLEHVQAKITLKYQPRGALKISLISPSGTISHVLFPRPRDVDETSFSSWPFLSVHFWGEKPEGTWRLIVQNDGQRSAHFPGKLFSWSLIFHGTYEKPKSYQKNATSKYLPRSTSPSTLALNECTQNGTYREYGSDQCVANCGPTQWANTDIGECQPCNNVCDSCFGPSSDHCLACSKGLFYEYHCLDKCPDGLYEESHLKECLPCSQNCKTCQDNATHCTECQKNFVLDQTNHRCVSDPALALKKDGDKCDASCLTCKGALLSDCLTCKEGHMFMDGLCIKEDTCPDGYFGRSNEFYSECVPCHHSCTKCSGPSHVHCLSCNKNATLLNQTCVFCLENHFLNHITLKCEACDHSCGSCTGPLPTDCLTCKANLYLDSFNGCVPCCSGSGNSVETEFAGDCCQCVGPKGPCSTVVRDKPRSIQSMPSEFRNKASSSDGLSGMFFVFLGLLAIAVLIGVLALHKTNRRPFGYKKVGLNYRKRRENMERKLDYICEEDDDDDDDCELMLYAKT